MGQSPDVQDRVLAAVRASATVEVAAAAAGIAARTFHRWLARGTAEAERLLAAQADVDAFDCGATEASDEGAARAAGGAVRSRRAVAPERAYLDFAVHVERARADAEVALVALITRASREDWRAAAWLLERSKPQRWGRRDNVTLDVGVNADGALGATDPVELADAGHDMLRRMIADEDERDAAPMD